VSESVEALAEKVRTGLHQARTCPAVEWAYDALATLLGRLAEAERKRDIAREQAANHLARLLDERKAAEARLAEAEKDRDRYRKAYENAAAAVDALAALDPEQP
jgi:hypothetical protein